MVRRRRNNLSDILKIAATVLLILVPIMFLIWAGPGLGLPADTPTRIIGVLPGIFVFFIGAFGLMTMKSPILVLPSIMAIGIGLAILAGELVAIGIVTIIGDPSLIQIQYFFIVFCTLLGCVAAVIGVKRR
jgi:hypothetical protein